MPAKYSLTLLASDQGDWTRCKMSTHMLARGLAEEFEALEGVDLVKVVDPRIDRMGVSVPECDVLLVHDYFPSISEEFGFNVDAMHKRVKCIALFLELGAVNADISFSYQRTVCKRTGYSVIIPAPYVRKYTRVVEKTPRTILLDHDYPLGGWPHGMDDFVLHGAGHCKKLYTVLEQFKTDFEFYQLERFPEARKWKPKWIKLVPQTNYPDYMIQTERMESFIATHPGSYNHTVVDMAARGTRIFSVYGHLSQALTDLLGVTVFGHTADYSRALRVYDQLPSYAPKLAACTPMDQVVRIMDREFSAFLRIGE